MVNEPREAGRRNSLARIWNLIVEPHPSVQGIADRRRAQLSAGTAFALFLINGLGMVATPDAFSLSNPSSVSLMVLTILIVISYILARTRYFDFGSIINVAGLSISAYTLVLLRQEQTLLEVSNAVNAFVPLAIVLASALLSSWSLVAITLTNFAIIAFLPQFVPAYSFEQAGTDAGVSLGIGVLLWITLVYRNATEKQRLIELQVANRELIEVKSNLESRVEDRTYELNRRSAQLESAALVARSAAEVRDLNSLLNSVVQQITARFGFYHAGIFLTDSTEKNVVLQAASSEGGKVMISRGHKLEIGKQGIVGAAAYQRRPRIAQDVGVDAEFFNNPDLPETHSEVALPLIIQNRVIGVLDIQSQDRNAFSPDDLFTLQTMADQIALAIENTRLINESRSVIKQLEDLTAESTRKVWKERLGQEIKGYRYTPLNTLPILTTNQEEVNFDATQDIRVPLNLRGKQIGNITLKRKSSDSGWTLAEQEMAERIATQAALALENARLLEESQRRALREQMVNEFSNRFSRSLDVDTLIQNAVRELHRIPQVSEVAVFISPTEENNPPK